MSSRCHASLILPPAAAAGSPLPASCIVCRIGNTTNLDSHLDGESKPAEDTPIELSVDLCGKERASWATLGDKSARNLLSKKTASSGSVGNGNGGWLAPKWGIYDSERVFVDENIVLWREGGGIEFADETETAQSDVNDTLPTKLLESVVSSSMESFASGKASSAVVDFPLRTTAKLLRKTLPSSFRAGLEAGSSGLIVGGAKNRSVLHAPSVAYTLTPKIRYRSGHVDTFLPVPLPLCEQIPGGVAEHLSPRDETVQPPSKYIGAAPLKMRVLLSAGTIAVPGRLFPLHIDVANGGSRTVPFVAVELRATTVLHSEDPIEVVTGSHCISRIVFPGSRIKPQRFFIHDAHIPIPASLESQPTVARGKLVQRSYSLHFTADHAELDVPVRMVRAVDPVLAATSVLADMPAFMGDTTELFTDPEGLTSKEVVEDGPWFVTEKNYIESVPEVEAVPHAEQMARWEQMLVDRPDFAPSYIALGELQLKEKHLDAAVGSLSKYIDLTEGKNARGFRLRAQALQAQGKPEDAAADLKLADEADAARAREFAEHDQAQV